MLIATTVAQVRQIISQNPQRFFIAISDLNLPDGPDGEVIDVLMEAGIPTIAVTGAFDRSRLEAFMGKGIIDYVLKNSINAYEYIVELVGRLYRNMQTKVIIAEDSKDYRIVLRCMLERQKLQVLEAVDGAQALRLFEQNPDTKLVLADYHMPKMDGFNLLAAIRRTHAKDCLAVIGMSSSDDKTISAQFLKLGGNDYLGKPFSFEELSCRITHNLQMLESIEKVRYVANHDYLTGLLNRRAFFENASKLHAESLKEKIPLCVAMMDIDHFKKINDTHGHDGGDAVLRHFAGLLTDHFADDITGRLGGEEFALLSRNANATMTRCENFRRKIESVPALFGEIPIQLTVSIGITCHLQANLDAMLTLADGNLYKAKASGRNRVIAD